MLRSLSWLWRKKAPIDSAEAPKDELGLTVLYEPDTNPTVDIIFVHGLCGNRESSWTSSNNSFWPKHFLPRSMPEARVLTYGYDTTVRNAHYLAQRTLFSQAKILLDAISEDRITSKAGSRCIIFVGHSLGGILIKSALIIASRENSPFAELVHRTSGVLFFGTPLAGSDKESWLELTKKTVLATLRDTRFLKTLNTDLSSLELQLEQYKTISTRFYTCSFCETPASAKDVILVPQRSAVPDELFNSDHFRLLPLERDHQQLVKFQKIDEDDYMKVVEQLHQACKQPPLPPYEDDEHPSIMTGTVLENHFSIPTEPPSSDRDLTSFVGREDELTRLLHLSKTSSAVQIFGPAGVGKTSLALYYWRDCRTQFSSIFWIDAENRFSLSNSFLKIARQLKSHYLPNPDLFEPAHRQILRELHMEGLIGDNGDFLDSQDSSKMLYRAVRQWLAHEGNDQWLLIIDGLNESGFFNLKDFIGDLDGNIIITSRSPMIRTTDTPSHSTSELKISGLDNRWGVDLFLTMAKRTSNERVISLTNRTPRIYDLVNLLDGIPLSIIQAATYIAETNTPLYDYLNLLEKERESATSVPWGISVDCVRKESREAWELLVSSSLLSDSSFPEAMFADNHNNEHALDVLVKFLLLRVDKKTKSYSIHPTLRQRIREPLIQGEKIIDESCREYAKTACAVVSRALKVYKDAPEWSPKRWLSDRIALPHVVACSQWAPILSRDDAEWTLMGNVCRRQGLLEVAENFFKISETMKSTLWSDTLISYVSLQPVQLLMDLRSVEQSRGPNHILTLEVISSLACMYQLHGKHDQAEAFLRRLAMARRLVFGRSHLLTLEPSERLGLVLQQQGKFEQAESQYKDLYNVTHSTLGDSHPRTLKLLGLLSVLKTQKGEFREAEKMYEDVIPRIIEALGRDDNDVREMKKNQNINQKLLEESGGSEPQGITSTMGLITAGVEDQK